jgi:hypothetical protein
MKKFINIQASQLELEELMELALELLILIEL